MTESADTEADDGGIMSARLVACARCGKAYLPHDLDGMGECENCIPADEVAFAKDLAKLDLGRLLDEDEGT